MKSKERFRFYLILLALFAFIFFGANLLALIFLFVVSFMLWYILRRRELPISMGASPQIMPKVLGVFIAFFVVLIILLKSVIVIPAGRTGVYHLFGRVSDRELSSGLHLVNPLVNVTQMSIRTEEYTMSVAYGEGRRPQADSIAALTKEGLSVDLDITVLYHLVENKASDIFKNVGLNYDEKIIRPSIRSTIRETIALYDAKDIYSQKRQEASVNIMQALKEALEPRGIEVEEVLLRNVKLPSKLAESIQDKLTAQQEAQRMEFVLDKEKKEAERKRIEAEGQRDAQRIIDESLTAKYLEYLYINSLKDRQGTIYVPVSPETGLPLFKSVP